MLLNDREPFDQMKKLFPRKLSRSIRRYSRSLKKNGGIFGLEVDDMIIGRTAVIAEGDYVSGSSSTFNTVFSERGKIDRIIWWVDYDDLERKTYQKWEFSNFKKFKKAIAGKHETLYTEASLYISIGDGDGKFMKRGIRMMKEIPGIDDFDMWLMNKQTYTFLPCESQTIC